MWQIKSMPKTIDYKLSDTELSQLEQFIKTSKSSRLVKRATGIRMPHIGTGVDEVGRALSVNMQTVYSWFHRWKAEGLKGLEHRSRCGLPVIADVALFLFCTLTIYTIIISPQFSNLTNPILSTWAREGSNLRTSRM